MMSGDMSGGFGTAFELNSDERDLIRSLILADPELVLADDQVMRTLIGASGGDATGARRVVDLRDRLVERMEGRLHKLVRTNRSVIAAAYENAAGTGQLHEVVLSLIDARDLGTFLRRLTTDTAEVVGVEEARLCLEADVDHPRPADELAEGLEGRVLVVPAGTVDAYLGVSDSPDSGMALREAGEEAEVIFGYPNRVRSEALLRLDLGGSPALLAYGAADPDRFGPEQGTDLLHFLAGVVERLLLQRLEAAEPA